MSTQQLVVMEALVGAHRKYWAWCQVGEGPGFEQIDYTETDGVTPVTELDKAPELGRWLFTVPIRAAVDVYPVVAVVTDGPNAPARVNTLARELFDGLRGRGA